MASWTIHALTTTRDLRDAAGLTQVELAWLLQCSERQVAYADPEPIQAEGAPWQLMAIAVALLDGQGAVARRELAEGDLPGAWLGILCRATQHSEHWGRRLAWVDRLPAKRPPGRPSAHTRDGRK